MTTGRQRSDDAAADEPTVDEVLHDFETPEDADLTDDVHGTGPQGGGA